MKGVLEIKWGEVAKGGGLLVVVDHDNVKVVEIDFATKYAEVGTEAYGDDYTEVDFVASEYTLRADETKLGVPTTLRLNGEWMILADCRRYTGYVCAYRRGQTEGG